MRQDIATKADLKDLEIRLAATIKDLEVRTSENMRNQTKWLAGLLVAQAAAITALVKLLP
jgi:primosomal protein N''